MKSLASSRIKRLFSSRRWVIGLIVTLLLLFASIYIWWSVSSWSGYENRYATFRQTEKKELQAALDMKTDTKDQRAAKLSALATSVKKLPSDDSLCGISSLIGWQRILAGELKKREEACYKVQSNLIALRGSLDKVVEYLESEHALAKLLAVVPAGGEVSEAEWPKQAEAWTAVAKNIEGLQVSGEFDTVKTTTKSAVSAIVAAWNEVLAAHQAKDKARYLKATAALYTAFDGLETIPRSDTDKLRSLLQPVIEQYKKLP
jgi:hypothetical protein